MNDKNNIGSTESPSRCSLCGNTRDLDALQLECITVTTWKTTDNKSFNEYYDPRVWLVTLCHACRVENYRVSLKKIVNLSQGGILVSIFVIILGGVIGWSDFYVRMPHHGLQGDLWYILLGFAGVIGLPLSIWFYVVNKFRLRRSENLQEIPTSRREQTFTEAGETILERLETGQLKSVYGDFPLPDLPRNPVPCDIPEDFKQATLSPKQKRLIRWIKGTF
ncbi:MAG: hypothetical protein CSYNP_01850 [Syntrophus sp. SKADARSKE-3]|nr:hypothetical protein [Syntrophus sp. SKADARSKE-3]